MPLSEFKLRSPAGEKTIGNNRPLFMIAGPCAMESRDMALKTAEIIADLSVKNDIAIIYKTSFDKANRTSLKGKRGIGLESSIPIFEEIRKTFNLMVLTDIHSPEQCNLMAKHVDILQIPAFLCRQTDLLTAAANSGAILNIKKGQFLGPQDMKNVVDKVSDADKVMITERGVSFGYNCLVNDFKALPIMAENNVPVVFDATHSVQQPGGLGKSSGGDRMFVPTLARAAVAVGVAGVFSETHPDPDNAPSDGPNMIPMDLMDSFIKDLMEIDNQAKSRKSLHAYC